MPRSARIWPQPGVFPQLRGRGQRGSGPCRGAGILALPVLPDAIVCGCDTVAIGVIEALHAAHIRIPEQIRVTGYDGIEFGAYLKTPLTTIAQPLYEIGMTSAQLLVERI
ncbi:MAG: substrate-binding domain-containing protein [Oscillospiraceae bacterium]